LLIGGILLGLLAGLLAGGDIFNLSRIRLRWAGLIFGALAVRAATELAVGAGWELVDALRVPILGLAFWLLLMGLWANRERPGITLAFVGILSNAVVILINGGRMVIWQSSLEAAGFTVADVTGPFHVVLPAELTGTFISHLGFLGDVIPVPLPLVRNVASIGDLFLVAGLGFFLYATALGRTRLEGLAGTPWEGRARRRPETGLAPGLRESATLDRPLVLGARLAGSAVPGVGRGGRGTGRGDRRPTLPPGRSARAVSSPPVRPPWPQRLVLRALDRAADQPVR